MTGVLKHKLLHLYLWFVRSVLFFVPDAPIIMRFRGWLYSLGMRRCGKNFEVVHNAILHTIEKISIGDNVYLVQNALILGGGDVEIGDEVLVGPNVVIVADNHVKKDNSSYRFGSLSSAKIVIGKNCWVGANCTLVANTKLPKGSVLGANSVLTKEFSESDSLYGGGPAKKIGKK